MATFDVAVSAGRAAAELLMVDTCEVRRRTGRTVQDEDTGREVPVFDVLFESPCKVQTSSQTGDGRVGESWAGGAQVVTLGLSVHLPIAAPAVDVDDVVAITAVGPSTDPQLLSRTFRVVSSTVKSAATARRIPVESL